MITSCRYHLLAFMWTERRGDERRRMIYRRWENITSPGHRVAKKRFCHGVETMIDCLFCGDLYANWTYSRKLRNSWTRRTQDINISCVLSFDNIAVSLLDVSIVLQTVCPTEFMCSNYFCHHFTIAKRERIKRYLFIFLNYHEIVYRLVAYHRHLGFIVTRGQYSLVG